MVATIVSPLRRSGASRNDFWSTPNGATPFDRRPPLAISVGRLRPVKGQDVLLRAFPPARARVPDARLLIIGDGGHREGLARLASDLGLDGAVRFAGQLDAAAVRTLMGDARAFVLPSRSEGLPLALLEAMAAGVPVVASRVGDVPDVVAPGTGVLVPPEDPQALADAMGGVLQAPDAIFDMSRRAHDRARQFSATDSDRRYEHLLQTVAGARDTAAA